MSLRRIGAAAVVAGLACGLVACGDGAGSGGGPTLRIGIQPAMPGVGLLVDGEASGFDVDVATYVAGKLGTAAEDIEWVEAPSAQREALLEEDRADLVVSAYSITDARRAKVDFAGPYLVTGQDLLVRADEEGITGPETLVGRRLCSVTGSTTAQAVIDRAPGVEIRELDSYAKCVAALASNAVDAVTTDDAILAGLAAQEQYEGKLRTLGRPFTREEYGIGLPKGDRARCEQVADALRAMIDDGSWQAAAESNFEGSGYTPAEGNPPQPAPCA